MSEDRDPPAEIVLAFGQLMIVRHDADRMVLLMPPLTDLGLPDIPGDMVIRYVVAAARHRPWIVVVTGYDEPFIDRARQAGAMSSSPSQSSGGGCSTNSIRWSDGSARPELAVSERAGLRRRAALHHIAGRASARCTEPRPRWWAQSTRRRARGRRRWPPVRVDVLRC